MVENQEDGALLGKLNRLETSESLDMLGSADKCLKLATRFGTNVIYAHQESTHWII